MAFEKVWLVNCAAASTACDDPSSLQSQFRPRMAYPPERLNEESNQKMRRVGKLELASATFWL